MRRSRWRVAVVGPGGVGGLIGGLLTRAGHRVMYVARPATVAALTSGGLHVRSAQFGEFHVPAAAVPRLAEPVDVCVIAVKATGLAAALDAVPVEVVGDALVVPLLNGVEHMDALRERFPSEQVVAGAIRVESTRIAPGRIEHASPFCRIEVASYTAPPGRVEALAAELRQAGIDATVRASERAVLWDKLAFLAPLALLTTYAAAPVGVIRDERRAELHAVAREVGMVTRAAGGEVDTATVLDMLDRVPPTMKSSMQRDAEEHRPTELEAIGGAVLRAAERFTIDIPITARLVNELRGRLAS